jgi:hypothetical protein
VKPNTIILWTTNAQTADNKGEEHMIEIGSKTTAFAASHGSKENT